MTIKSEKRSDQTQLFYAQTDRKWSSEIRAVFLRVGICASVLAAFQFFLFEAQSRATMEVSGYNPGFPVRDKVQPVIDVCKRPDACSRQHEIIYSDKIEIL